MRQTPTTTVLSERAQCLFKALMERYLSDGQPVGSRLLARDAQLDLSPATVRNVMADLEEIGLIRAPHTSAGRIPTVSGYRLFVDSMLTVKKLPSKEVREICKGMDADEDVSHLVSRASNLLADFTNLTGVVMVPRIDNQALRQVEFLPISEKRVLVILVTNDKDVQNRIIHTERSYTASELQQAANYLNLAFTGQDIRSMKIQLLEEMSQTREQLDGMMQAVIEMGRKAFDVAPESSDYVMTGQTNLMEISELSGLDKLRQLFEAFTQKRGILHLLDQALDAQGVQIFIGEESGFGALDECSVVTSTYENDGQVLGVLGVIGPLRMCYGRVIPLVDMTAKMLGLALKCNH